MKRGGAGQLRGGHAWAWQSQLLCARGGIRRAARDNQTALRPIKACGFPHRRLAVQGHDGAGAHKGVGHNLDVGGLSQLVHGAVVQVGLDVHTPHGGKVGQRLRGGWVGGMCQFGPASNGLVNLGQTVWLMEPAGGRQQRQSGPAGRPCGSMR